MNINIPALAKAVTEGKAELKAKLESFPLVKGEDGNQYRDIPQEAEADLDRMVSDLDAKQANLNRYTSIDTYLTEEKSVEEAVNRLGVLESKTLLTDEYRATKRAKADWSTAVPVSLKTREVKNVIANANNPVFAQREDDIVPLAARPVQLLDFFPMYSTEENAIVYRRQTVRTNAAAAKLEGQALAQSTFSTELVTEAVRVIGHTMDITEEEYADEPTIAALMMQELPMMVRQEADRQLAIGDGGATELDGLQDLTGAQTPVVSGTDNKITVIRKMIKNVRFTGRANPNLIIMHPDDWEKIYELQDTTGKFFLDVIQDAINPRLSGLPVVQCDAITAGQPMVLDTMYFPLVMRQGMTVEFTNSDGEKFANRIRTARAYVRMGIKHRRPTALIGATGF